MIKWVFLDLDDTVFDFGKCERAAISETLAALSLPVSEELIALYSEVNLSMWRALERGEITKTELRTKRFSQFFDRLGVERDSSYAKEIYEKNLSEKCFFIDGAEQLLSALSEKYELYGASNGIAAIQDGRIKKSGIARFFKEIFISERVGYNKPSAEFFNKIFNTIEGFDKECAIMVGDSLTSDIQGGINAGIKTCLYSEKPLGETHIVPDYHACSLQEILTIIANI